MAKNSTQFEQLVGIINNPQSYDQLSSQREELNHILHDREYASHEKMSNDIRLLAREMQEQNLLPDSLSPDEIQKSFTPQIYLSQRGNTVDPTSPSEGFYWSNMLPKREDQYGGDVSFRKPDPATELQSLQEKQLLKRYDEILQIENAEERQAALEQLFKSIDATGLLGNQYQLMRDHVFATEEMQKRSLSQEQIDEFDTHADSLRAKHEEQLESIRKGMSEAERLAEEEHLANLRKGILSRSDEEVAKARDSLQALIRGRQRQIGTTVITIIDEVQFLDPRFEHARTFQGFQTLLIAQLEAEFVNSQIALVENMEGMPTGVPLEDEGIITSSASSSSTQNNRNQRNASTNNTGQSLQRGLQKLKGGRKAVKTAQELADLAQKGQQAVEAANATGGFIAFFSQPWVWIPLLILLLVIFIVVFINILPRVSGSQSASQYQTAGIVENAQLISSTLCRENMNFNNPYDPCVFGGGLLDNFNPKWKQLIQMGQSGQPIAHPPTDPNQFLLPAFSIKIGTWSVHNNPDTEEQDKPCNGRSGKICTFTYTIPWGKFWCTDMVINSYAGAGFTDMVNWIAPDGGSVWNVSDMMRFFMTYKGYTFISRAQFNPNTLLPGAAVFFKWQLNDPSTIGDHTAIITAIHPNQVLKTLNIWSGTIDFIQANGHTHTGTIWYRNGQLESDVMGFGMKLAQ